MARKIFFLLSILSVIGICSAAYYTSWAWYAFIPVAPLILIGIYDCVQSKHAIRRNFPVIGNLRYFFEEIRPEINQYFIESNTDGAPYSRERRSMVYQRAKSALDKLPFGTQKDVYADGYEWVNHSMAPTQIDEHALRVRIGGPDCTQPYDASILNISAMSYGALSKNAVQALNQGAKMGAFAHNTGEGGVSPHHLQGGDLIWQIGTGYFGCRKSDGTFDAASFATCAKQDTVKLIEVKLSQGAKPGHGGILPGSKVDAEIAAIRKVPIGKSVLSPPAHSAFDSPIGLLEFIKQLRELSGGKPVGFKLCVGKRREFLAICKAIIETNILPDFIVVDGGEGGTGAAPLEFSNHIGCPLSEGLIFVHNALVGIGRRNDIKIISAGKIASAFDIIKRLALGADICYGARSFMLALGCIQALRCHQNNCPTGVATQDKNLVNGLVVSDKNKRVAAYHDRTIEGVAEMLGAMGLHGAHELRPWHILRRIDNVSVKHYGEIYDYLDELELLRSDIPNTYRRAWNAAQADSFSYSGPDISTRKHHVASHKSQ